MAKIPKQLSFARPLIFFIRKIIWKILGANDTAAIIEEITLFPRSQPVDHRMLALWERLNILESHVNWRLHGLPSRLVNLKLEQAKLLAGSGEIETALETFKQYCPIPPPLPELLIKIVSEAKSIFMFPGDNNYEWNAFRSHLQPSAKVTVIDDTSDLLRYNDDNELVENEQLTVLRSSAIDASARLIKQEFDFIWISSILERVTPIQAMIMLKRSRSALSQGGAFAGMISPQNKELTWPDPRFVNQFNLKQIELLFKYSGIEPVKFKSWGDYELFNVQKE